LVISYLTRKENIILSAIEIIDELGLHELSIREIARRQQVSDASLYKHFKSKQEILIAVLEYYSTFDSMIIRTIEESNKGSKEGLTSFYRLISEYYENYPSISAVMTSYQLLLHDEVTKEKVEDIYFRRNQFIRDTIEKAKIEGHINSKHNSEIIADIIQGAFMNEVLMWRMKNYKFSLQDKTFLTIELLLGALK
jgi:AcrR family transcriptional regulator